MSCRPNSISIKEDGLEEGFIKSERDSSFTSGLLNLIKLLL